VLTEDLITVIVPIYNVEKYLPRCLDSLLSQTYRNLEIILVDDGSPDRCGEICDEYAEKDSRIQVIHQSNGGVSSARNHALNLATGDYIGFVDPDDDPKNTLFEFLYQNSKHYNADISICGFYQGKDSSSMKRNTEENQTVQMNPEQAIRMMLNDQAYRGYLWNKLFRRELLIPEHGEQLYFEESIHLCEDLLMCCRCMLKSKQIVYDTQPHYYYTIRDDGACKADLNERKLTILKAIQMMKDAVATQCPSLSGYLADYYANVVAAFVGEATTMSDSAASKKYVSALKKEYALHVWDNGYTVKKFVKYGWVMLFPKMYEKHLQKRRRR